MMDFVRELLLASDVKGAGGPRPKIECYSIFVEGKQSYQMLFTGSKNIDLSHFHNRKIHTITLRPHALLAIISKFDSYRFWDRDLKLGSYIFHIIPNNLFFSDFWVRS